MDDASVRKHAFSLRVIAETSFESRKFQDFVLTGAERWLEVIQDWTRYGKVASFSFLDVKKRIFANYIYLWSYEFEKSSFFFVNLCAVAYISYFQDLHFIFYERLCDDPVSLKDFSVCFSP